MTENARTNKEKEKILVIEQEDRSKSSENNFIAINGEDMTYSEEANLAQSKAELKASLNDTYDEWDDVEDSYTTETEEFNESESDGLSKSSLDELSMNADNASDTLEPESIEEALDSSLEETGVLSNKITSDNTYKGKSPVLKPTAMKPEERAADKIVRRQRRKKRNTSRNAQVDTSSISPDNLDAKLEAMISKDNIDTSQIQNPENLESNNVPLTEKTAISYQEFADKNPANFLSMEKDSGIEKLNEDKNAEIVAPRKIEDSSSEHSEKKLIKEKEETHIETSMDESAAETNDTEDNKNTILAEDAKETFSEAGSKTEDTIVDKEAVADIEEAIENPAKMDKPEIMEEESSLEKSNNFVLVDANMSAATNDSIETLTGLKNDKDSQEYTSQSDTIEMVNEFEKHGTDKDIEPRGCWDSIKAFFCCGR